MAFKPMLKLTLMMLMFLTGVSVYFFVDATFAHTPSSTVCNDAVCNIDIKDNSFSPASITIKAPNSTTGESTMLIWQNHGISAHTVTSGRRGAPDGIFDQTLSPGSTFQLEITLSLYNQLIAKYPDGVVPYYCSLHFGMDATLKIVNEPTSTPTPTVSVAANPTTIQSGQTSTITVQVTFEGNPVTDATVTLSSDNGGTFTPTNGVTDTNGYFASTFTAPSSTVQTSITITAAVTKTGYQSTQNQSQITVNPITTDGNQQGTSLWIYIAIPIIALVAVGTTILFARRRQKH